MTSQNDGTAPEKYDHSKIEQKWQSAWEEQGLYHTPDSIPGKENFYTLVEFTYPSGDLHVGHWYAFSVPDIFARYKRMRGFNVLYPTGFDAFGLPAENAAIKLGADPKVLTYEQMDRMRGQIRSMGAMYDWSREVVTCDPAYYKWTQWMFNQFLKKDLVHRAVTKVNWCPKDKTVLANEQVVDGKCERCGSDVVQREQPQWMLRITKYADQLIDDLDGLDWPHAIKESQRNWIGRSDGSEISFKLQAINSQQIVRQDLTIDLTIDVFTTRADTLFGVTYVVLAPEHELVESLKLQVESEENKKEIEEYIENSKRKSELDRQQSKEKTGVELKGIKVINPANGEEIPVWIADYVLAGYGTGAVMAVPAHDERDFEFAKKYELPIKRVVEPKFVITEGDAAVHKGEDFVKREAICAIVRNPKDDTYLCISWKDFKMNGLVTGGIEHGEDIVTTAIREISEETGYKNIKLIRNPDFAIQTQFYHRVKKVNRWARFQFLFFELENEEQDSIHTDESKVHEVVWKSKKELEEFFTVIEGKFIPKLIDDPEYIHTEDGVLHNSNQFSDLDSVEARKKITEFVGGKMVSTYRLRDWGISRQRYWGTPIPIVYDPEGNAHPVPDEHLPWILPTDVDHTPDGTAPLARSKELFERTEKIFGKGWTPEVETMDTFVDSSWYFYRYLDNKNESEFASKERMQKWMPIDLYMGGAEHTTMHVLYSRFWVKALRDCGLVSESEPYIVRRNRGTILGIGGVKMSKSKPETVVNPDEIVQRLGADTVRMYLAFMGPYGVTTSYPWDPNGVVGVRRFLERLWNLKTKVSDGETKTAQLHKAIKKITEDIEEYKFNTAIAQMMILINEWEKAETIGVAEYKILLQLLAPFAPHMSEELWRSMGETESIHLASWPTYDEKLLVEDMVTIAVQINGKLRADFEIAADASKEETEKTALALAKIKVYTEGKEIKKVVVITGKIVNIVI